MCDQEKPLSSVKIGPSLIETCKRIEASLNDWPMKKRNKSEAREFCMKAKSDKIKRKKVENMLCVSLNH